MTEINGYHAHVYYNADLGRLPRAYETRSLKSLP
jgi:hypothetical protein